MGTHAHHPSHAPVAIGAAMIVGCTAAIVLLTGGFAPTLEEYRSVAQSGPAPCGICGVVTEVREIAPGAAGAGIDPVQFGLGAPAAGISLGARSGEGTLLLIGAMGGMLAGRADATTAAPIHEIEVRLDDGSVRVLREARRPAWQRGDRVRVIRGAVERLNAS